MHKAIAVIQFKVEGAMIRRHPEYEMDDRVMLANVDYEKGTVDIDGKAYPMMDMNLPTVDPKNPLELSRGEKDLLRTCLLYTSQGAPGCCGSRVWSHGVH